MNKLVEFVVRAEHKIYKMIKRMRLKNKNMTVFSSNCNGAYMLHDLGCPLNSPTVNMAFDPKEYFKFLNNPEKYLLAELKEIELIGERIWRVQLEDIVVRVGHYKTFTEAREAWKRRAKRVNMNNVYVVMTDRDGCTYEHIKQFDELPYKNKVIFTHKKYEEFESAYYIPGFETENEVGILSDWKPQFLKRRWLDDFDYVRFFNQK